MQFHFNLSINFSLKIIIKKALKNQPCPGKDFSLCLRSVKIQVLSLDPWTPYFEIIQVPGCLFFSEDFIIWHLNGGGWS